MENLRIAGPRDLCVDLPTGLFPVDSLNSACSVGNRDTAPHLPLKITKEPRAMRFL